MARQNRLTGIAYQRFTYPVRLTRAIKPVLSKMSVPGSGVVGVLKARLSIACEDNVGMNANEAMSRLGRENVTSWFPLPVMLPIGSGGVWLFHWSYMETVQDAPVEPVT